MIWLASIPTFDVANTTPLRWMGTCIAVAYPTPRGISCGLEVLLDVAGNTWKDPIVLTNQPGVGTPYSPIGPGVLWFITRGTQVDEEE